MLLFFTMVPVAESFSLEDYNDKSEQKYLAMICVRGWIKDLKEEYYNGTFWYNFTIVNALYLQIILRINPIEFNFFGNRLVNFNLPCFLPKDKFIGFIKENYIFGTAFMYGDWRLAKEPYDI